MAGRWLRGLRWRWNRFLVAVLPVCPRCKWAAGQMKRMAADQVVMANCWQGVLDHLAKAHEMTKRLAEKIPEESVDDGMLFEAEVLARGAEMLADAMEKRDEVRWV